MPDEITDAITTNATGPQSVEGDAAKMSQHPLQDQIAADRYTKAVAASRSPGRGIVILKSVPPGTV